MPNIKDRLAALERKTEKQQAIIFILLEFCKSVANNEKTGILSYQQLYSPSADSCRKVRMLFQKIRKLG